MLCRVWGRNYEAQIVTSMLWDAGIDAMMDCDPRGPMHFYSFPLGSPWPAAIYVPPDQYGVALQLLETQPLEDPWAGAEPFSYETFASRVSAHRRLLYAAWLLGSSPGVVLVLLLLALGVRMQPSPSGEA